MDFISMKETLKTRFFPVLVIFGDDEWLKSKAVSNVRDCLQIDFPDVNCFTYEQGVDVDELITACNTLPFFSKQKFILVENFAFPTGKKASEVKSKLENYLQTADDSCVLVFVSEESKPFEGIKGIELVNCKRLAEKQVVSWITAYCKRQGRQILPTVATKISQYCLCDMARVATETEKLCSYATSQITDQDVELLVHKDTNYEIFKLGEAIASKNNAKSLDMLQGLLNRGEQPRALFGLLYNFYRRMYYVRTTNYTHQQLADMLGVKKDWMIRQVEGIANQYKPMQLKRALDCFASCDEKLKRFFNESEEIQLLVLNLLAL